eukprot:g11532.t1
MGRGGSTQKKFLCSGRASDGGGCQSEVRATMGRKSREWRISYVDLQHANCSGGVAKATGATLAPFAAEAMANNPNMNSAELGRLYKKNVGLQAKPRTVRRHKKDALDAIQAADAGSIQQAPGYCRELVERSPGTVATVERNPDGTFNRLSIVVGRAAFVIAKGLFKFLQIDGGHMKGKWNGMVLVATGKDTNNTLVVVAFVICDKENAANYSFLLSEMKKNPHLKKLLEDPLTTLYTDEHKGSKAAIQREAEPVIHRLCLKHLAGNFPGPGIGETVNSWLFAAARTPSERQCMAILDKYMKPLKPQAYASLMARDPKQWAHWAQPLEVVCADQVTNNSAESTMNMIGHPARKLPPLAMAISILESTAKKCAERVALGQGGASIYTPFGAKLWETEHRHSTGLGVLPTGNGFYNIRDSNIASTTQRGNRVQLLLDADPPVWSCTCGYPLRFKVPCRHIIAVGKEIGEMERVMGLIHPAYRLENYRQAYEDPSAALVLPVLEMVEEDTSLRPPLPVDGQSGRPKKGPPPSRRILSKGEKAASASNNVRMSELPGAAPGSGGLSQGAGALSQGTGVLSQGAPTAPINIG